MRLLVIHGVHMLNEAQDLIGIADLVIIPGDHLHKGVGQGDTGLGVEDRGVGVAQEVGGNHSLVGIIQDTLQLTLGGLLHGGAGFQRLYPGALAD